MSNGNRKKVSKVTVEFNDGTKKTYPDNGYMPVALFWSDHSVIDILGSYYDSVKTDHQMTYEKLQDHFGATRAIAVCSDGPGKSVTVDKKMIEEIWNTPNQALLPPLMSKDPGCDAGG
jgi:hypothetical protein